MLLPRCSYHFSPPPPQVKRPKLPLTTAGSRVLLTSEQIYLKLAVSAGVIEGSVIAGLVVIAAAAVRLAYILRCHGG